MTDPFFLPSGTEATARQRSADLGEPGWLLAERMDAIHRYETLPPETNQLFTTYLDLRSARFEEIEPYQQVSDAAEVDQAVPEGAAGLLHLREDRIVARGLSPEARAAGVVLDALSNVDRALLPSVRALTEGGRTLPATDKFAQFARATAPVALFIHVPGGVQLTDPLVLRWSVGEPGRGLVSRTIVSLGAGASARLLEEQGSSVGGSPQGGATGPDSRQSLWAGTMEVVLGEGATLEVAAEQNLGGQTVSLVNRHATIGQDATLRWALASVGSLLVKSRIDNELVGRGATVNQVEIGFGGGSQLFDLTSYTRHKAPDTTGDLLSKGVFQDRARGYLKGLIQIERQARGTDSYLGEFAMLLAKKARSVAIPSLEIDQPDVRRASHSSSVGPIDESQVFYLMSRGLTRELARKFITLGFLEPVVARIPLPAAQERLRRLLDEKWISEPVLAAEAA
ncbi:MAG: SufD family Fe-S cluster assembly protein [Chloroflexi bacterium]|nr:SufD family Fe-S cluster assembly protein [Chloroflexota bacterium]